MDNYNEKNFEIAQMIYDKYELGENILIGDKYIIYLELQDREFCSPSFFSKLNKFIRVKKVLDVNIYVVNKKSVSRDSLLFDNDIILGEYAKENNAFTLSIINDDNIKDFYKYCEKFLLNEKLSEDLNKKDGKIKKVKI